MAGILDGYFPSQMYPGSGGGILSRLPEWMLPQAGPSQGFPGDTSGYAGLDPSWLALLKGGTPAQAGGAGPQASAMPPSAQAPIFPPGMTTMGQAAGYGAGMDALQFPDQAQLPPSAMPTASPSPVGMPAAPQGQQVPQAAPQAPASPGMLDRLSAGATNFTTGGNPIAGLINAIGGLSTGQRTDRMGMVLQQQRATMQALIQAGVDPATAQAAALNPEILKTIAAAHFDTAPKLQETGTDPLTGQKSFSVYKPNTQTLTPVGAAGISATGAPPGIQEVFDRIEQSRNAGAPVSELLQHVPNSLREGVSAMIAGRAIPANLSNRGQARDLALRFAHQIDPAFDETLIPGRAQFARGMAQTTPNSPGGQKILLNTSLQHTAELAQALTELHNTSGILTDLPGSGPAANLYNRVANSSSRMGETVNKVGDIAQKVSGEVGKLYSGSSGGGEAERQATTGRFSHTNTPNQSIGGLEATRNLILDKLNALQNQRDQVYGATGENVHPLVDKETQKALKTIDDAIAKLRLQASGGAPNPPQSAASQGIERSALEAEARRRGLIK